jgi:anti-sigma factor RsiW
MPGEKIEPHLTAMEVAAYVDNGLRADARARVRRHLSECDECRGELIAVARLARTGNRIGWKALIPLAAAAALVLYVAPWQHQSDSTPVLREPAVTTIVAPTPIAPRGAVTALPVLTWSSVPLADRYKVTLFDEAGSVLWETLTADTTAVVAPTVRIVAGVPHYWKVAARTELGRWVASDLISFTLSRAPPAR